MQCKKHKKLIERKMTKAGMRLCYYCSICKTQTHCISCTEKFLSGKLSTDEPFDEVASSDTMYI